MMHVTWWVSAVIAIKRLQSATSRREGKTKIAQKGGTREKFCTFKALQELESGGFREQL